VGGPNVDAFWWNIQPPVGSYLAEPIQPLSFTLTLSKLTVSGSAFVPGAVLTWNGAERTTSFVDASQLTIAIPASDPSHAGAATLVVNNPGSSNSSSISLTIN
jgi:hypothetical protein